MPRITVDQGRLWRPDAPSIPLDTPQWTAWLDEPSTTRFSYALFVPARGFIVGWMTVRKEPRARGTAYWVASRRREGRIHKVYLGRSAAVTLARLRAAATQMINEPLE